MTRFAIVLVLVAAACSNKANRAICEQAADRYTTCVGEILGPDGKALADSKRQDGVKECAGDAKTVEMYKTCLPKTSCNEFMDCMTEYAAKTAPH